MIKHISMENENTPDIGTVTVETVLSVFKNYSEKKSLKEIKSEVCNLNKK